ncbi:MAG TPA: hypothetical protein VK698_30780 [Kofleriaceae bacterium]|nr:hypothetical protein [Kofleriaceae bacterium]
MSDPEARGAIAVLGALAALLAALLITSSGCAASLEDPDRFTESATCPDGIDVETDVFAVRCAGSVCHSPGDEPAGGLDLVSDGVAGRVAGIESPDCDGEVLAVPGDPDASLIMRKLGASPPCGSRMPLVGSLGPGEAACIADWIAALPAAAGAE